MGRVYRFLGLTLRLHPVQSWSPRSAGQQYAADITYGTNNEFGFDYLRDNMAWAKLENWSSAATTSPSSMRSTRSSSTRPVPR